MTADHVVKVRTRGHTWTSPRLAAELAADLASSLRRQCDQIGAGQGFISFTTREGRRVDVRGRDVVVLEHGPADPPRAAEGPPPAPAAAATAGEIVVERDPRPSLPPPPPTPATAFPRRAAGAHPA